MYFTNFRFIVVHARSLRFRTAAVCDCSTLSLALPSCSMFLWEFFLALFVADFLLIAGIVVVWIITFPALVATKS